MTLGISSPFTAMFGLLILKQRIEVSARYPYIGQASNPMMPRSMLKSYHGCYTMLSHGRRLFLRLIHVHQFILRKFFRTYR